MIALLSARTASARWRLSHRPLAARGPVSLLAAIALSWLGLITLAMVGGMIAVSPGMAMASMSWSGSPGLLLFCRLTPAGHPEVSGASMIGGMGPVRSMIMWLVM